MLDNYDNHANATMQLNRIAKIIERTNFSRRIKMTSLINRFVGNYTVWHNHLKNKIRLIRCVFASHMK